jgi:hypothetical protein
LQHFPAWRICARAKNTSSTGGLSYDSLAEEIKEIYISGFIHYVQQSVENGLYKPSQAHDVRVGFFMEALL